MSEDKSMVDTPPCWPRRKALLGFSLVSCSQFLELSRNMSQRCQNDCPAIAVKFRKHTMKNHNSQSLLTDIRIRNTLLWSNCAEMQLVKLWRWTMGISKLRKPDCHNHGWHQFVILPIAVKNHTRERIGPSDLHSWCTENLTRENWSPRRRRG